MLDANVGICAFCDVFSSGVHGSSARLEQRAAGGADMQMQFERDVGLRLAAFLGLRDLHSVVAARPRLERCSYYSSWQVL